MAAGPTLQRIRYRQIGPRVNGNSGGTSESVIFAVACLPGSLIVVVMMEEDGTGLASVSDPTNGSYTRDVTASNTTGTAVASTYVFSKQNVAATALTISITKSATVNCDVTAFELIGCAPTSALDSTAAGNGIGGTDFVLSITTLSIDCAVFQIGSWNDGAAAADTGFQSIFANHGGSNTAYMGEYTMASGAARAINVDQSIGVQSTKGWAGVAAAYKAGPVVITPARFGKVGYDPTEIIVPAPSLAAGAIDTRYHPKILLRGPPQ